VDNRQGQVGLPRFQNAPRAWAAGRHVGLTGGGAAGSGEPTAWQGA